MLRHSDRLQAQLGEQDEEGAYFPMGVYKTYMTEEYTDTVRNSL